MARKKRTKLKLTPIQRKLIIGIGVYLGFMGLLAGYYVLQNQSQYNSNLNAGMEADQRTDISFLDQMMLDLLGISSSNDSSSNDSDNPAGKNFDRPIWPWLPGIGDLPDGSGGLDNPLSGDGNTLNPISNPNPNSNPNGTDPMLSDDQLTNIQGKVTMGDRVHALNIIRKRLSAKDIQQLVTWSQGGITSSEKVEIIKLLNSRLSAEEMLEVKVLYEKYK
jgi:hypothetical protein